jgi:uncharacterized membrane protein/nitrite reductase/ring-hydroxylating ferredoxin subunit
MLHKADENKALAKRRPVFFITASNPIMKSRVHIKSHPLHPILVVFPIAFFSATMVFHFLALVMRNESFDTTSFYMNIAGLVCGVAAAIPGIVDYNYTVPPQSTARRRAMRHGLLNATVILLFLMSLLLRLNFPNMTWPVLFIEVTGVAVMIIAGWMGGTLVHRNQIGIDHRYAGAGRWKEVYIKTKEVLVEVGADDLQTDQMMLVHVNGKRIVIGKTDGGLVAFDDRCTHRGGSLAAGTLICGVVQCPWHGSQFDTLTGEALSEPAHRHISIYNVYMQNEKIMLDINPVLHVLNSGFQNLKDVSLR